MSEFNISDYRTYGTGCFYKENLSDYVVSGTLTMPSGAASTIPVSYELKRIPIKNQCAVNSCVAHSIAEFFEITEYYQKGYYTPFSTGFLYQNRLDGQYRGSGMYPNEALDTAKKVGIVPLDDYPEDVEYDSSSMIFAQRKDDCLKIAPAYKLSTYARITTLDNVKISIAINHNPVIIICDIYDSFYNTAASGIVPNPSGQNNGSHAMLIVGYTVIDNQIYYKVQNSWGDQWAMNGYCFIKPNNTCITALYTAINEEDVAKQFKDVKDTRWSKPYIDKCVKAGLIVGDNNGNFNPTDPLTREQAAVILSKIMSALGTH